MTIANMNNMNQARHNISMFMLRNAELLAKRVGFGYVDVPDAPNDYEALRAAWGASKQTGLAFPVWNGGSDSTVYTSCGANFAFRFWHDYLHASNELDFSTADEIKIGIIQVKTIQADFGLHSLEALIMFADTIEQSLLPLRTMANFQTIN